MRVARVVSGGQTGVDRAALDTAVALGLPYGGWCPAGGLAEDLPSPPGLLAAYPLLQETPDRDPDTRTEWNVGDSDATLIVVRSGLVRSPGTRLTVSIAQRLGRPHLVARWGDLEAVRGWLAVLPDSGTLNVAGPRESQEPGSYEAALRLLLRVLG